MDYKKYSLENLENWLHDAMESDATPTEIYDVIVGVVKENYYHHKHHAGQTYELLALLNGDSGQSYEDVLKEREYYEPTQRPITHDEAVAAGWIMTDDGFWISPEVKMDEC